MTKIHIASMLLLTIVSSIFVMPQQKTDELQSRVDALETTVSLLSERVSKLEVSSVVTPQPSSEQNPKSGSDIAEIDYEVVSIDAKITESNNIYDKHSWILTVKNNGRQRLLFNATIDFLDKDGFIVDQDFGLQLLLEPYETKDFIGTKLVNAAISGNIVKISAKTIVVDVQDVVVTPVPATPVSSLDTPLATLMSNDSATEDFGGTVITAVVISLAGASVYIAPDESSTSQLVLKYGTEVKVLGRNKSSESLKIQTGDGYVGWIATSSFEIYTTVESLPITSENDTENQNSSLAPETLSKSEVITDGSAQSIDNLGMPFTLKLPPGTIFESWSVKDNGRNNGISVELILRSPGKKLRSGSLKFTYFDAENQYVGGQWLLNAGRQDAETRRIAVTSDCDWDGCGGVLQLATHYTVEYEATLIDFE